MRLCDILDKPNEPGFVSVDGGFKYLGELTVDELGEDDEIIIDSEGNEWQLVPREQEVQFDNECYDQCCDCEDCFGV